MTESTEIVDTAPSLNTVEGIAAFITELAKSDSPRVMLQGLQTAALALRPQCDNDDFRLMVPAEVLWHIQQLPMLNINEFPPELQELMVGNREQAFAVMQQLRVTTLQEVLKALGFYVPCHCGLPTCIEPLGDGCGLQGQVEAAFACAGNGPDVLIKLAPEDDDENASPSV